MSTIGKCISFLITIITRKKIAPVKLALSESIGNSHQNWCRHSAIADANANMFLKKLGYINNKSVEVKFFLKPNHKAVLFKNAQSILILSFLFNVVDFQVFLKVTFLLRPMFAYTTCRDQNWMFISSLPDFFAIIDSGFTGYGDLSWYTASLHHVL